jgi:hypothetical protein
MFIPIVILAAFAIVVFAAALFRIG